MPIVSASGTLVPRNSNNTSFLSLPQRKRPKIKGVCKDYREHERQRQERQDAAELARRIAEYEDRMRYEQHQQAARNQQYEQSWQQALPILQRDIEAYGVPAPRYYGQQYAPTGWPNPQAPGPSYPR
ncbi:hypothetical protein EAE96_003074 [Botrytis aclada]|nr:hypothetical protein EAE96_003074 [Botrytis aclada]